MMVAQWCTDPIVTFLHSKEHGFRIEVDGDKNRLWIRIPFMSCSIRHTCMQQGNGICRNEEMHTAR